jgi:DNA-binding SARP family transcriptional activator/tetratricopeptide (TPR) repeat protein
MEFRLFGRVELQAGGQLVDLGPPRQQAVLAALIVDAPRPVAIEALIDRVWDDAPPVGARNVLYSHLSRIRRLLRHAAGLAGGKPVRVVRCHAGYMLDVDAQQVDLHRFGRLVELACDPRSTDGERATALGEALDLWRGPPLAGLCGEWVTQVRRSWHRRRMDAVVQWAEIELRLGHPAVVIAVLYDLVEEYPYVEPLEVLLLRALHAAGRDAEAIDRYAVIRKRFATDLGTDPGPELDTLHQAILRGELSPPAWPEQVVATAGHLAPPAQLPPDMYGFTGRGGELRRMDGLLMPAGGHSTAVVILAVSGTAGVGKTALAVHWAHRISDEFVDGQLYVNLQGFDPTGSPVTPADALRGFFDAFAVPPERIPADFQAQIGLYRSLLATRRVLVVLDNARDAGQVRPLLPAGHRCAAVVTSRDRLSGLVAEGAHPLTLDLMTDAEARLLLARRVGARRVAAEPHAVDDIITLCARLPLALAVVAARAATHPGFDLAALAAELHRARGRLDPFIGADPATDARAVFSWSYQQLSPDAARLFRLLGIHPGPDIAVPAAASLTGLATGTVRPLLAELAQVNLVTEHTPGRYTFHDLLRAHATELAHTVDTDTERRTAMHRVLAHYVHAARAASHLLGGSRRDPITVAGVSGAVPIVLADHAQAMAWFNVEHPVLLAVTDRAADGGFDTETWQLAWALFPFFDQRGHWHDLIAAQQAALDAAVRLDDRTGQAYARRFIGFACIRLGRADDARTHLRSALALYAEATDHVGEARVHVDLCVAFEAQGCHHEALAEAQRAFNLFRAAGHQNGQAVALGGLGWIHARLGDLPQALTYCQRALTLHHQLNDSRGEAMTRVGLGYTHRRLGHHSQAVTCFQHALELFRAIGDRYWETIALSSLGDTHHAAGQPDAARAAWQQALRVLDQLNHPDAERVRGKLATDTPLSRDQWLNPAPPVARSDQLPHHFP